MLGGGIALDRRSRNRQRGITFPHQLHRMAETHTLALHHPLNRVTAFITGTQAMPQVLVRTDHQGRFFVVVERTRTQIVLAVLLQLDAGGLHQAHQSYFAFQAVEFRFGYSGHISPR